MLRFHIKAEKPPVRCEICHQSDCLDPIQDQCLRCLETVKALTQPQTPSIASLAGLVWKWALVGFVFGGLLGGGIIFRACAGYVHRGKVCSPCIIQSPGFSPNLSLTTIYVLGIATGGLLGGIIGGIFKMSAVSPCPNSLPTKKQTIISGITYLP